MIEKISKTDIFRMQELTENFPKATTYFPIVGQVFDNDFRQIFTISEKERIIGYLILDIIYERAELIQIEIQTAKRNQGYGKKLLHFVIDEIQRKNLQNITLEVRRDNEIAIHLYEEFQFKKVAIRKNYYHGIDGILMERKMM